MVPAQVRAEIESGKYAEDRDGDDLLNHFELHGREATVAEAVGGNLETVLEEGDAPANENHFP